MGWERLIEGHSSQNADLTGASIRNEAFIRWFRVNKVFAVGGLALHLPRRYKRLHCHLSLVFP